MWANPQDIPDLLTFTKKDLMENGIFCAVVYVVYDKKMEKSIKM